MYFVVCSDNHGNERILKNIRKKHPDACAYIHCGDSEMRPEDLDGFVSVRGNCDYYSGYEDMQVVKINDDLKILVIHSHKQNLNRLKQLCELAHQNDCQMVCYGHTHRYHVTKENDIILVNPGSLRYNRDGTPISYALVYYEDDHFRIVRVNATDIE